MKKTMYFKYVFRGLILILILSFCSQSFSQPNNYPYLKLEFPEDPQAFLEQVDSLSYEEKTHLKKRIELYLPYLKKEKENYLNNLEKEYKRMQREIGQGKEIVERERNTLEKYKQQYNRDGIGSNLEQSEYYKRSFEQMEKKISLLDQKIKTEENLMEKIYKDGITNADANIKKIEDQINYWERLLKIL